MRATTIKDLKVGEYFTLKEYDDTVNEVPEKLVWIRGEYERSEKKYSCTKFVDFCHENFFKGTKVVYTDIYF